MCDVSAKTNSILLKQICRKCWKLKVKKKVEYSLKYIKI